MHSVTSALVVLVGLTVMAAVEGRARRLEGRMRRVEGKIDLLLRHGAIQDEDPALAEVAALARAGRRTAAVKKYREATGADLLEAKRAVDRLDK
jgi:ribosomal protein L7/L12